MKIAVLNGSPKGLKSITMQSVQFIKKEFAQHELEIINISQKANKIKKDPETLNNIIEKIKAADAVLWATPVYYFLVPSQYKTFIELIFQEDKNINAFRDKYTSVLTTSVHLLDHIAHNYLNAICDDLSMKFLGSFSADMHDFLDDKERQRLLLFMQSFFNGIEKKLPTAKKHGPIDHKAIEYKPSMPDGRIDMGRHKCVILNDAEENQSNLFNMANAVANHLKGDVEVINLYDIDIKTGCQGCYHCAYDNTCRFEKEDEFVGVFNSKIEPADILLFCGTIKDRYLSSRWKLFIDRTFFKQHVPCLSGKQLGFLISGPLKKNSNLRQALEAYSDLMGANLVDIITDENESSEAMDALLSSLAQRLIDFAEKGYYQPRYFYSIGAMKIMRDLFWGKYRFLCQADHKFYKNNGIYDFPQKNYKDRMLNNIVIPLTRIPSVRKKLYNSVQEEMIKPYAKILNKIGE